MKTFLILCLAFASGFLAPLLHAENNGAGLTPPLGWSSWSFVRKTPTEANIEAQASAIISSGLAAHGFEFVNVDDYYYLDPATTVDVYGRWVLDPTAFPDGMAVVGSYVHGLGLKFGLYMTPGIPVAAYNQNTPILGTSYHAQDIVALPLAYATNYNGSFGSDSKKVMYKIDFTKPGAQAFINSWANLLASYGADYLKLDGVGTGTVADIQAWSAALQQSGRLIHFELSNSLAAGSGATWRQYTNGWRIEGDIEAYGTNNYPLTSWSKVSARFTDAPNFTTWAGPGGWNDLDSLELGNGANDGLTADQRQTAMTLWTTVCSPLFLGTDLTNMDSGDLALLTNDEVLQVDQAGSPAAPLTSGTTTQVWRSLQWDGSYIVALYNLGSSSATVSVTWAQLGITGAAVAVRDLWARTDLGAMSTGFSATVVPYGSRLLRVVPAIPVTRYCANAAANTIVSPALYSRNAVCSDGVKAGYVGQGGTLTFGQIVVPAAASYNVTFAYLNGDTVARTAQVSVNGGSPTTVSFPTQGSYAVVGTLTVSLPLLKGANTITLGNPTAYAPDFDSLVVQAKAAPATLPTPIQAWRTKYFGAPDNTGSAADLANPAGDGIPNLTKYAFGMNPLVPGVNPVTMSTDTGYLSLRVPLYPYATDVSCTVQFSSDLVNWTTNGTTVDQHNATLLRVHDSAPVGSTASGQFLRVQATATAK